MAIYYSFNWHWHLHKFPFSSKYLSTWSLMKLISNCISDWAWYMVHGILSNWDSFLIRHTFLARITFLVIASKMIHYYLHVFFVIESSFFGSFNSGKTRFASTSGGNTQWITLIQTCIYTYTKIKIIFYSKRRCHLLLKNNIFGEWRKGILYH